MKQPLRITETEFSKHISAHGNRLAVAAGLAQHQLRLHAAAQVGGIGDFQVRVPNSPDSVFAINQRDVRETVVQFWNRKETGEAMFVGYSEGWSIESKYRRLVDAAVRFFYHNGLEGGSPSQLLRFEWADAMPDAQTKEFVFAANGAGTPHWHYDGLQADQEMRDLVTLRALLHAPPETQAPKEFGAAEIQAQPSTIRSLAGWFGGIHFPVLARWHETPLLGLDFSALEPNPHASSPRNIADLQNMMSSAVYYVRQQLNELGR